MPILQVVIILALIGVGLWAVNTYLGPKMQPTILWIINGVVILAVVLWILQLFHILPNMANIRVGR